MASGKRDAEISMFADGHLHKNLARTAGPQQLYHAVVGHDMGRPSTTRSSCFASKPSRRVNAGQPATAGQVILPREAALSLRDPPPESDGEESDEERYEKGEEPFFDSVILVSNVAPVEATAFFSMPDWGPTADGYD